MKVLHVVGTRPNFMKVAPVVAALSGQRGVDQLLVHTGQHYDTRLSGAFFEDLALPQPDFFLEVGSGSHGEQTAHVILRLEPVLAAERPDVVVVPGDVNSTLGAAIAAVKLGLPVIHLEAGLRSYDRTMPEEHNRVVVDHLADLLLTPSRDADENLRREGIAGERIAFVGNVMIDSLRAHEVAARALDLGRREYGAEDYLLVTLHRPATVDDPDAMLEVIETLELAARSRPVLFPVHPRTHGMLEGLGWKPRRVRLLEPQGYLRFLSLEASAAVVLTDSGGVQEETTALGVPCLTLRANTERPVTMTEGTNRLLGVGSEALVRLMTELEGPFRGRARRPEGWDGMAAGRVAQLLVERYGSRGSLDESPTRATGGAQGPVGAS